MEVPKPRHTDRETAREILTRNANAPEPEFSTIDPAYLRNFAATALRWIDCAPEGANHSVAPMQDKLGVPMGTTWSENMGVCKALRDARAARGLHPLTGARRERFVTQFGVSERWANHEIAMMRGR